MKIAIKPCPKCGSKNIKMLRSIITTPERKRFMCHDCFWCSKRSTSRIVAWWLWNHQKGVSNEPKTKIQGHHV